MKGGDCENGCIGGNVDNLIETVFIRLIIPSLLTFVVRFERSRADETI